MSKTNTTQNGKTEKHMGQNTPDSVYARALRKTRVTTPMDVRLLDRIRLGASDEPEGALSGSSQTRLSASV